MGKLNATNWIFSGAGQGAVVDDAIRNQLAQGRPVTIAFPIYSAWDNLNSSNDVLDANNVDTSTYRGGHEVMVYGYNSTGLLVQNSWGTGWGNAGRAIMAWNFVEQYPYDATYTTGWQAPPPANLIEDTSTAIKYTGTWSSANCASASCSPNHTERWSKTSGSYAVATFTGTRASWLATKGPAGGKAKVYVDGVLKTTVNLYSATIMDGQAVYKTALLPSGKHTLKIKLASAVRVNIDAIAVTP